MHSEITNQDSQYNIHPNKTDEADGKTKADKSSIPNQDHQTDQESWPETTTENDDDDDNNEQDQDISKYNQHQHEHDQHNLNAPHSNSTSINEVNRNTIDRQDDYTNPNPEGNDGEFLENSNPPDFDEKNYNDEDPNTKNADYSKDSDHDNSYDDTIDDNSSNDITNDSSDSKDH